jgi:hypothetical protein
LAARRASGPAKRLISKVTRTTDKIVSTINSGHIPLTIKLLKAIWWCYTSFREERLAMPAETDIINFDVDGNIFTVDGTFIYDTANPQPGLMRINITNASGKWIDAICEIKDSGERLFTTGRINDPETFQAQRPLTDAAGQTCKIYRWAPGAFGISGSGGGDIEFVMPNRGDATIKVRCTG